MIRDLKFEIFSKMDFSDPQIVALRDANPSPKNYSESSEKMKIISEFGDKVFEFLFYSELRPDKWDTSESYRENFDYPKKDLLLKCLGQPGTGIYLRKNRTYSALIENCRIPIMWEGKSKVMERRADPLVKSNFFFWFKDAFSKNNHLTIMEFFFKLFKEVFGEYGFLCEHEEYKRSNHYFEKTSNGSLERYEGQNLQISLPGIYWVNIFGKTYIDFFSESKFNKIKIYEKKKQNDNSYLLKLASDSEYYLSYPDGVVEPAESIKKMLGELAFYNRKNKLEKYISPWQ
jgi:hypothetical protein